MILGGLVGYQEGERFSLVVRGKFLNEFLLGYPSRIYRELLLKTRRQTCCVFLASKRAARAEINVVSEYEADEIITSEIQYSHQIEIRGQFSRMTRVLSAKMYQNRV